MMSWRAKSYEVLPALSVRGRSLRQSLRLVTIAWMWGVVWVTCVSGDQMRAFARMVGFDDFAFGLLAAIPFLATLGQLPAAILVERTGLRKYMFLDTQVVARLLWVAIAVVPLVFWPGETGSTWAVATVLVLVAATNFLAHVATPPWLTWMGDLIPRRIRGRYFARRTQLAAVVQILAVLAVSVVLDRLSLPEFKGRESAARQPVLLWAICGLFVIGAVFGVVDVLLFRKVREIFPPARGRRPKPVFVFEVRRPARWSAASTARYVADFARMATTDVLLDPLKDRVFRRYVWYGTALTFSMTAGGWYYWKHASEVLGFNMLAANVLFLVIGPVSGTLTAGLWGRLIDRWGRRPVLIVATAGTAISVLPWLVAGPHMAAPQWLCDALNGFSGRLGWLVGASGWQWITEQTRPMLMPYVLTALGCVVGGSSWTAVTLAQTAIILGFSDGTGRNKYVAASSVLINMGGALGGIVGGLVAKSLGSVAIPLGFTVWNNYQVTFALGMMVRVLASALLVNMPDPGSSTVRGMLRYWSENAYNTMMSRMFYPLRLFGWGPRNAKSERKDSPRD